MHVNGQVSLFVSVRALAIAILNLHSFLSHFCELTIITVMVL